MVLLLLIFLRVNKELHLGKDLLLDRIVGIDLGLRGSLGLCKAHEEVLKLILDLILLNFLGQVVLEHHKDLVGLVNNLLVSPCLFLKELLHRHTRSCALFLILLSILLGSGLLSLKLLLLVEDILDPSLSLGHLRLKGFTEHLGRIVLG